MQTNILAKYPQADLKVYTIWLPMLGGDSRLAWEADVLPDERVLHFWDADRDIGRWFAEYEGYGGTVWDTYYVFGPEATWESGPAPLLSVDATIIDKREKLAKQILPLLQP